MEAMGMHGLVSGLGVKVAHHAHFVNAFQISDCFQNLKAAMIPPTIPAHDGDSA
jgi:hypothetical protein